MPENITYSVTEGAQNGVFIKLSWAGNDQLGSQLRHYTVQLDEDTPVLVTTPSIILSSDAALESDHTVTVRIQAIDMCNQTSTVAVETISGRSSGTPFTCGTSGGILSHREKRVEWSIINIPIVCM
jgi:hypothetical protein